MNVALVTILLFLVIAGSVVFHILSPWWFSPLASNWGSIDNSVLITFWVTGFVFVVLSLFLIYCVWKYRYQKNRKAEYKPENKKLEFILAFVSAIAVVVLLTPGLKVWNNFIKPPKNAVAVEVLGYQWGWNYRLAGKDGVLGKTSIHNISDENPYGLYLDDPYGQDDLIVQDADLHLQLDKPVKLLLRSIDVLHNFYVPEFRAKMDLVPGLVTYYWLIPTRTGEYEVLCAELCGVAHYAMLGIISVDDEENYSNWLTEQQSFEQILAQNKIKNKTIQLAEK
ncbi:MAG: cytochrome c oxidase subunit II [Alphaproteobacteria bacterium]|jgi:cytochrome c oxidase subunit 2|nr:cytochrome c oxidase subunit II [Alphaproteobacteria bacterium]